MTSPCPYSSLYLYSSPSYLLQMSTHYSHLLLNQNPFYLDIDMKNGLFCHTHHASLYSYLLFLFLFDISLHLRSISLLPMLPHCFLMGMVVYQQITTNHIMRY